MADKPTDVAKLLAEIRREKNDKIKPITRLTGSSYSAPKPPLPIEWEYWRLMLRVDLWTAVALSVNLNPDTVKLDKAGDVFDKRLSIAESHALARSLPLVYLVNRPRASPVLLAQFAAWAKDLKLPMPPELLALAATETTAATVATPEPTAPLVVAVGALGGAAWVNKARERAAEIIKRQRENDLFPSQENLSDEIAKEFRTAGIVGAGGKPLSGASIKRHALIGISSATGKQLSTRTGRGK